MPTTEPNSAVTHLSKSFRAGVPLRIAFDDTAKRFGTKAWDSAAAQRALLDQTIYYTPRETCNVHQLKFSEARCTSFVRLLMDEIDHLREYDVDESVVEVAAQFCQKKRHGHDIDVSHVIFEVPAGVDTTSGCCEIVLGVSNLLSDLGHRVWDAGLVLYVQAVSASSEIHHHIRGRRILELGAGTGLCARAYVDAGAAYALLTDYEEHVVRNMKSNIKANAPGADFIEAGILDATNLRDVDALAADKRIDTIVAADVTYDETLLFGIVRTFEHVLRKGMVGFLIATRRNEATHDLLETQLRKGRLQVEELELSVDKTLFEGPIGRDFSRVVAFRLQNKTNCSPQKRTSNI